MMINKWRPTSRVRKYRKKQRINKTIVNIKIKIKQTDKIIYEEGTCLERNEKPKNIGNIIQYNFF